MRVFFARGAHAAGLVRLVMGGGPIARTGRMPLVLLPASTTNNEQRITNNEQPTRGVRVHRTRLRSSQEPRAKGQEPIVGCGRKEKSSTAILKPARAECPVFVRGAQAPAHRLGPGKHRRRTGPIKTSHTPASRLHAGARIRRKIPAANSSPVRPALRPATRPRRSDPLRPTTRLDPTRSDRPDRPRLGPRRLPTNQNRRSRFSEGHPPKLRARPWPRILVKIANTDEAIRPG